MKKLEQHVDCILVCASVCIPTTGRLSQLLHIEFDVSDGFVYHHSLCLFTSTMYSNLVLYIYIYLNSMDWFKGKFTGNHGFYH